MKNAVAWMGVSTLGLLGVVALAPIAAWSEEHVLYTADFEDTLEADWEWLREDPADWRLVDGALEIRSRPGLADTARNVLRLEVPQHHEEEVLAFEVTVTFTTAPTEQYEQAGLTWYADEAPVFKLVHERIDGELFIIPGRHPMEPMQVRLRLEVNIETGWLRAFYRDLPTDDEEAEETDWELAVEQEVEIGERNHIALVTYHGPEDSDHWMRFSDFRVVSGALDDYAP